MAEKWSTVQSSDEFQGFSPEQQQAVKERYFANVISLDDLYQAMGDAQKEQVQNRFFSTPTPQQQENAEAVGFKKNINVINQSTVPFGLLGKPIENRTADDKLRLQEAREAREEFLRLGGTEQQLDISQKILKKVDAPPIGRAIGASVGSVAVPAILGQIPPFTALPEEAITIPLMLSLTGAGVGGAVGEATQVGIEEKRMAGKRELLGAAGKEMATELGFRGLSKAAGLAFSPFIKKTVPEAAAILDDYAKFGGVLPPSSVDKRMSLTIADEVARGSFGARQVMQDIAEKNVGAAGAYQDAILDLMARGFGQRGSQELGQEFAEGITRPNGRVFNTMDELFDPLYAKIDDLTVGGQVDVITPITKTSNVLDASGKPIVSTTLETVTENPVSATVSTAKLKEFARKRLTEDKSLLKKGAKRRGALLTPAGREQLDTILDLKDKLSFKQMRGLRSKLLRDTRKLSRDADQSEAMIRKISSITNDSIFDPAATSGLTKEASNLLQNTNRLYSSAMDGLERNFSEKLLKRLEFNPSSVTRELFPAKNPTKIAELRTALTEPVGGKPSKEGQRLFTQLRTSWMADTLQQAERDGIVSNTALESQLRRMGPEALKEMFPDVEGKRQLNNLRSFTKLMAKKGGSEASLLIRGSQLAGVGLIYNGVKEDDYLQVAGGGALVMGPLFFARLAGNPIGNKLLRSGVAIPKGSNRVAPIAARMINLSNQIKKQQDKQRRASEKKQQPLTMEQMSDIGQGL